MIWPRPNGASLSRDVRASTAATGARLCLRRADCPSRKQLARPIAQRSQSHAIIHSPPPPPPPLSVSPRRPSVLDWLAACRGCGRQDRRDVATIWPAPRREELAKTRRGAASATKSASDQPRRNSECERVECPWPSSLQSGRLDYKLALGVGFSSELFESKWRRTRESQAKNESSERRTTTCSAPAATGGVRAARLWLQRWRQCERAKTTVVAPPQPLAAPGTRPQHKRASELVRWRRQRRS